MVIEHNAIVIPEHEVEVITSRAGGPGGQHVNKTETRITLRWNIKTTHALTDEQKERILKNLAHRITEAGDLIVHNSSSRSQHTNKIAAFEQLAQEVKQALRVPKKRKKTKISQTAQEKRLQKKSQRSSTKKLRSKKGFSYE